ncbi:MAG: alpha/beta fold hydrolase, partial [Nevskiaceae bacterium]
MRHLIALALAGAAAIAACGTGPTGPGLPLELVKCQDRNMPEPLLCGMLPVRENRLRPTGAFISLKIVVVPATGARTLPPLYHFEGGPGLPATDSASFWVTDGAIHRQHRDIVLVDQRGTGGSNALPCALGFGNPLEPLLDVDSTRACRYQLSPKGELSQYTTAATVADIEAVRMKLGHERIDLSGRSYGTRVAQQYLQAHPQRVRAMLLIGTVTPQEKLPLSFSTNAQGVLMRLAQQCEADAACRRAVPKAGADIATLRARFAAGPVRATLADKKTVTLQAGPFWEGVRAVLTTTASQRRLPWLLHEAARGRFAPILAAMP